MELLELRMTSWDRSISDFYYMIFFNAFLCDEILKKWVLASESNLIMIHKNQNLWEASWSASDESRMAANKSHPMENKRYLMKLIED